MPETTDFVTAHVNLDTALAELTVTLLALGADPDAADTAELPTAIADAADSYARWHAVVVDPVAALRFCVDADPETLAAADADLGARGPVTFAEHAQLVAYWLLATATRDALTAHVATT